MLIGCLQVELLIPDSGSLKEKRMVLSSLKQRLKNKYNVSVAEIDFQNLWQRASLGIVLVANDHQYIHLVLDKILNFVDDQDNSQVIDYQCEII